MEFWAYYRILRRRRWLIVVTVLTAIAVVLAADRPGVADFEATATLSMPSAQRFFFVAGGGVPVSEQSQSDVVRASLALSVIRSWDVAERVVQRLNLDMRPDALLRRLTVERERFGGDLLRVTMTGATPQEAVTLANAVAQTAASYDQELKRREATLAREFLEKQAGEAQAKVSEAEDALVAFQQKNAVELATSKSLQVAGLQTDIQRVDLSLQEVEARLASVRDQLKGQNPTRSDQVITDTPIALQLRSQLAGLEVVLTSELALHTEKHLNVVTLRKRIQAIKDRLNTELGKTVAAEQVRYNPLYDSLNGARINLETEKLALLAKKEALWRATGAGERALPGVAQKMIEQSRLATAVDLLRRQYESLQREVTVSRLREQEAQHLGSITLVNPARTAQPSPFGTKLFKLSLASVLGVLGSAGLVLFLEYLDVTLKIPENAERLLGVPALVAIPKHNPPFEEAYRQLRVNLEAHRNGEGGDAFVVTAPRPGEGTSTVVTNLARAFARAGRPTIVVDAALRRPTQHVHFGIANERGLTEVLRGEAAIDDVLAKTDDPNLRVLPSGAVPQETDELLCSGVMAGVLADLKQRGGVILVDTPAAGTFTDAFSVAPLASGVLLVLDARQALRGTTEQVKSQFTRLGAKVLGVVVTKVRPDLVDSYVNQEHFYKEPKGRGPFGAAAVGAGALVLVVTAGVITGVAVKAMQSEGLAQWISALSLPWLSGH